MVRSVPVSAIALVRAIKSSLAPAARQTDLVAVPPEPERAAALLRRRDFRRVYLAVAVSELGDAFQYIALMWFAPQAGGPLGVIPVRLADSVPALLFGLHGGVIADRFDRRRAMIAADIVRAEVLVPHAIPGLAGPPPGGRRPRPTRSAPRPRSPPRPPTPRVACRSSRSSRPLSSSPRQRVT